MFKKILIANRGEIACRVAATARRIGIRTVAVYSEVDAHAKHVAACDQAVALGGSTAQDSYLRWEKIIQAAQATQAQAIHPGYGFLSENAEFAQACLDAGLVFIGPSPAALQAMGLKAASKQLMAGAGVPLVPGYHGADQDPDLLLREASRIGYPVLIKASAGGGGKGMRVVQQAADFRQALHACQREALGSFGLDVVLIEKYVQRPRHIEMQIFGDSQGNYVHLFERDCSVQRRHQKVLEEAPAPGMSERLRAQMGAAAIACARAVQYVGAGTVEFIVEQQPQGMAFFFMEMNTRLQVEHPVTEAITGLDLVEWQLRIASGQPLPLRQSELHLRGHAIEARICAENPDLNFMPATGTLQVYRKPAHVAFTRCTPHTPAVRIDDGVRQSDGVSPFYDGMIAKVIVHGDTRAQALAQLDAALAQVHIVGVPTNVQFLRYVVRSPAFDQADLDTHLITRQQDHLFGQNPLARASAIAAAVAYTLAQEQALQTTDPFSQRDAWCVQGTSVRPFVFEFGGQPAQAWLTYSDCVQSTDSTHSATARTLQLRVPGTADSAEISASLTWRLGSPASPALLGLSDAPNARHQLRLDLDFAHHRERLQIYLHGAVLHIFSAQGATQITLVDPLDYAGEAPVAVGRLSAPMPGKIVSFAVQVGDTVAQGQTLAIMEAMKMEHSIVAPHGGIVQALHYASGDQVSEGAALLTLTEPNMAPQPEPPQTAHPAT